MPGKRSKRKGANGERELAAELVKLGICNHAHRGRQYSGGPDTPDVKTTLDGVHFEVKRVEAFRLYPSLEQAKQDAPDGHVPVVAHRRNRERWVACVYLDDLLALMDRLGEERNGGTDTGSDEAVG